MSAQNSIGGYPPGLLHDDLVTQFKSSISVHIPEFSQREIDSLGAEYDGSPLFAFPVGMDIDLQGHGNWVEWGSYLVYRLELDIFDHGGLIISYEDFDLPPDALLFVYEKSGSNIHGAYTADNNRKSGRFLTGTIWGKEIVIEYLVPKSSGKKLGFEIDNIYRVLITPPREEGSSQLDTGFQASYPCHLNINCPEGDDLQLQKKGVVRIMMVLEEGIGFCSGSLVNNTDQDLKPYVLSAFHCQYGYTPIYDLWKFDFEFESPNCENPQNPPGSKSMLGCQQRAGRLETDFLLLELLDPIPMSYDVYYNGWDKSGSYTSATYKIIHHPAGDVKKVSVESDNLFVFNGTVNWDNESSTPPQSHLRCSLDAGGHQAGSSGGPMFSDTGLLIGQLHGGSTDEMCEQTRTYVGRFSESWTGTTPMNQLSDWLDPSGVAPDQWAGKSTNTQNLISVTGTIQMAKGAAIPNVIVRASSTSFSGIAMTDGAGQFILSDVDLSESVKLTFELNVDHADGISGVDLVLMRNHILGLNTFQQEYQILSADANNSNTVSAADIIQTQNVLLGLWEEFPNNNSWGFLPADYLLNETDNGLHIEILGYKLGDVNGSADPGN